VKLLARETVTVVYNGPALFENKERFRGNKHSEGETTLSEGEWIMAKKAHKKSSEEESFEEEVQGKEEVGFLVGARRAAGSCGRPGCGGGRPGRPS
jgi:hypothetical protein